ncbi:uncharacterized protein F4822DRAFT_426472 [Hypoxylon trugodes]|uniref:uncharacterized protein n=1 Tax=Hypoxylon trugodes TaxID=326681 RepID=UPI00219D4827|nr:uncharacterized protein F4822DRAFT_426472 [Hypoxylon trugodes]KAI1390624.1 hypothetical protein F4822DRAFT_426472 [Hypoxylon trugodes]
MYNWKNKPPPAIIWVKGMKLGPGAPHSPDFQSRIDQSERSTGEGTIENPMVVWPYPARPEDKPIEQILAMEAVIRQETKECGLSHVWIAADGHPYSTTATRGGIRVASLDDYHVTIRMGSSSTICNLHGHLYLVCEDDDIRKKVTRVMTEKERGIKNALPFNNQNYHTFKMLASISILSLLALANANPVPRSAPRIIKGNAYQLQVQLRDPLKDLSPGVSGQYLAGSHVGAGLNIAIVSPHEDSGNYPPFYSNGTAEQGWTSVVNDLGTIYPWGVNVQDAESTDATYPGEHDADINVGGGSNGIVLTKITIDSGITEPALGGLAAGYYAVCNRFIGYSRANMTVVRYVYEGEDLADGCVGVNFVPLCATLNDLPEGNEWTHDFVQEVDCVEI